VTRDLHHYQQGAKVLWYLTFLERNFQGAKGAWERKFQGAEVPGNKLPKCLGPWNFHFLDLSFLCGLYASKSKVFGRKVLYCGLCGHPVAISDA